jgi:hypothetical protein
MDDIETVLSEEVCQAENDREVLAALLRNEGNGNSKGFELLHERPQIRNQADRKGHIFPIGFPDDVQKELFGPVGRQGWKKMAD